MKISFFIGLLSWLPLALLGQDTIKVEPSHSYSSKKYPVRGKLFASNVKYGREDIIFSPTKTKVEYCYYYDNKRMSSGGTYYEKLGDMAIRVTYDWADSAFDVWNYERQENGLFSIEIHRGDFLETGYATSIVPLQKTTIYTTYLKNGDTLWTMDFTNSRPTFYGGRGIPYFTKTKVEGHIYQDFEVDTLPKMLNGDSLPTMSIAEDANIGFYGCYGEPLKGIRNITFVVTKEGDIKNVEQFEGNLEPYCDGKYIMKLMEKTLALGRLKPGIKNGVPVNTRCYLPVDMGYEGWNETAKHPAFDREKLPSE